MDATPLPVVIPNPVVVHVAPLVVVHAGGETTAGTPLPPPPVPTVTYFVNGRIVVVPVVYGSVPESMFAPVVPRRMPMFAPAMPPPRSLLCPPGSLT